MPFAIPRIQWKNYTLVGDRANSSALLQNLTTTVGLEAGMFVRGTGIQTGTTIVSIDSATQITMSLPATSTATGASFTFGFEILFTYPPVEKDGESVDAKERISISIAGVRQVSVDFLEGKRKLNFSFLPESLKLQVENFMKTWAVLGKAFRYFDDQTLSTYFDVELNTLKYTPKKIAPKGIDVYVWDVPMEIRRVL